MDFKPVHIKAYSVGINVKIKPAVIIKGVWPVFTDSAGYVINGKNLIIYGHNTNNIFGPIRQIKEKAEIVIFDNNFNKYRYQVVNIDIVNNSNMRYIESTTDETLTLYTCAGLFDSKRFIVVAKRII